MQAPSTKISLAIPFLVGLVLFGSLTTASAGTVTKTFPDLEGQVRLFLDLPVGISHREFRQRIPAAWRAIADPRFGYVGTIRGPSNNDRWFIYRLAARGIQQPQIDLRFWKNELVFAFFNYKHRFAAGIDVDHHESALRRIDDLLMGRFGESKNVSRVPPDVSHSWRRNGVSIEYSVSDDGIYPRGNVTLALTHEEKYNAAFNSRGGAGIGSISGISLGAGPGLIIVCSRSEPTTGLSDLIVATIDTRSLSSEAASRLAERRSKSVAPPEYQCSPDVGSHGAIDVMLDSVKLGLRAPYTYLRFIDEDGFMTSMRYQFAGPDTEDAVCEEFRKRLPKSIRASAECVTGIELPYKVY